MTPTQKIKTVVHARHFHVQIVEHTLVLKHCLKACVWITNGSHTNKVTTYLSFLNCSNANEGKIQISVIQKKVSEANSSGSSGFETAVLCIINIPTTITLLSLLDMLNTCFPLAIKSLRRRLFLIVFSSLLQNIYSFSACRFHFYHQNAATRFWRFVSLKGLWRVFTQEWPSLEM